MSIQKELDQLRDPHRRTALAVTCQRLRDDPSLTPGRLILRLRTEMRHGEWFEYETNIHWAAEVIVGHALRIAAEHGFTSSAPLELAISFVDFSLLRTNSPSSVDDRQMPVLRQ